MLALPVLVLLVLGVAVVATSASERPRLLSVLGLGAAGLVLVLVAVAVLGVGLRGASDEEAQAPSAPAPATVTADRPSVEVREVDAVVRPRGTSDPLDRLPDVATRLVRIRTNDPVVARQCVGEVRCRPGVPMRSIDGSALGLVELRRMVDGADCATARCTLVVTRGRSNRPLATVPLWFGRPAPAVVAPPPVLRPTRPEVDPDLPGARLAAGLAAAAVLFALAAWLLHRRSDERAEDPFWGVSLDVPEWEGIEVVIDEDEWLSPAGGAPARRGG